MALHESRPLLRVVTYNIHKCRGLDRRVRPDRIVKVLKEINADIVALQEVVGIDGEEPDCNQYRFISEQLGFDFAFGKTRPLEGGAYGNVILSRFPIHTRQNFDITSNGREPRGCLRTDIQFHGSML